ncbi:MAG: epimerase [Gemmatimonadota bacterium]
MNILLFGATGMVGAGALLECLADPRVSGVISVSRTPTGRRHPKLREVLHTDFFGYDGLHADFAECDACLFCLGVSVLGLSEADYTHLTYDLTVAAAHALLAANTRATFCYVSGVGTDSTEKGRSMWARVKGRTENALLAMPFKASFMFRPGFIQPMKGVRSKTAWYQAIYSIAAPVYPLLHRLFPQSSTTTEALGRAMIQVAVNGYARPILYSRDINALAMAWPGSTR